MPVILHFGVEPCLDIGQGCLEQRQIRLLRQIPDGGARLGEAASGIRLHQTGSDAQQGRLPRAVPSDQAQPVPGPDRQSGAGQHRGRTKTEADILQQDQGWRHGRQCLMFG